MALLLLTTLPFLCCTDTEPPSDGEPTTATAAHEEARDALERRNREAAEAFRLEQGGGLPTTAEEVMARHIELVGGREAFDTIQTMVLRFTAEGSTGTVGELLRFFKKPLLYRQQMVGSDQAAVTNGTRVWRVRSGRWEVAEGETGYLPLASMDNHLIAPELAGIRHELVGVAALDGDPGFEILRIWPHGEQELLFFSAVSGLLTARKTDYRLTPESWFSYWDYRDFGGVRLPVVHIRSIGDLGPPHGLVLQSVEINVPLPDSLFLPPDGGRPSP
jgi:hypothetical protein